MESLQHLHKLMDESIITILGYEIKNEDIKDEFISRLKHYNVGEINSSFDVKSTIRDIKLDSILGDNEKCDYLHLDVMDIVLDKEKDDKFTSLSKSRKIHEILEVFRQELLKKWEQQNHTEFGLDFDDSTSHQQIKFEPDYKLIVTAPLYRRPNTGNLSRNAFTGGDTMMFTADLVGVIEGGKLFSDPYIKLIKNRQGSNIDINIDDITNTVKRNRKLSSILPKI